MKEYLLQKTGFEQDLKENDRVCYTCYKAHLLELKQCRSASLDEDLLKQIEHLHDGIVNEPVKVEELLNNAILRTSIDVGHLLLNREVALFTRYSRYIFESY